jgi:hypothetical protein
MVIVTMCMSKALNGKMELRSAVFWVVAPCESCKNRHFGGTYFLHLQGRKILERRKALAVD